MPAPIEAVMSITPVLLAGAITVTVVGEITDTPLACLEPNLIITPDTKFEPVMVTWVPPAAGPLVGDIAVIVGAP